MLTRIVSRFVLPILLGVIVCVPTYAQKFPKVPKTGAATAVSTKAAKALSPAHQAALLHVQRIRELSALKKQQALEAAIAASKTQIIQPSVIERTIIQKTLEQSPTMPLQPQPEPAEIELAQDGPEEVTPTLDIETEDINLQLRLLDLEKRIQTQQEKQLHSLDENPLWKRRLASLPPRKTAKMWIPVFEDYVLQYHKFPKNAGDTSVLYHAYLRILKKHRANHSAVRYLQRLREQYPPEIAAPKLPKQYLAELQDFVAKNERFPRKSSDNPAERALHKGIYNAMARLGPEHPFSKKVHRILKKYPNTYKTPQEWVKELKTFIKQNNRFPNADAQDAQERALGVGVRHVLERLDPQDPISIKIRNLHAPFAAKHKTPQDWADELETFAAEHKRFPSQYSDDPQERILNKGVYNVLRNHPMDPAVTRIRAIQQQFSPKTTQVLDRLQKFTEKYEYFPGPSLNGQEDKLYWDVIALIGKLPADSPILAAISHLKIKYKRN